MDLSALQTAAKALERSLDSLGFWLFTFTALVVVGLIVEYRHEVVEFWEEVRRPAAMFPWQKFWAITGGILVTVGVAGELIVGIKASRKEGDLRTINHQIEALLTDKASENEKEAANANERAGKAEERTAELLREIQPRRLSLEQERHIADSLKSYAGKTVSVATYHQDAEAMILAVQIEEALRKANILVWDRIGTFGAMGMPLYIGVTVDTNSSDKDLAAALFKALKTKGGLTPLKDTVAFGQGSTMFLPPRPTGSMKEDAFIFVGEKPIVGESLPNAKAARKNSNPNAKP